MNKRIKKFRAKVMKYHKKWKRLLGLSWWNSNVDFYDTLTGHKGCVLDASCTPCWEYLQYTIDISEHQMLNYDNVAIEKTIIHELLHAVVTEMREKGQKHVERVVTQLQYCISCMLDEKEKEKK